MVSASEIEDIPPHLEWSEENAYVCRRFDRNEEGLPIHIEDLARDAPTDLLAIVDETIERAKDAFATSAREWSLTAEECARRESHWRQVPLLRGLLPWRRASGAAIDSRGELRRLPPRSRSTSRRGGWPNIRLYSRLNCEGSS